MYFDFAIVRSFKLNQVNYVTTCRFYLSINLTVNIIGSMVNKKVGNS